MCILSTTVPDLSHVLKQSLFDFHYDDEDTVMNEIDEFYSYVEMSQVAENMKAWEDSYHDGMHCRSHPIRLLT